MITCPNKALKSWKNLVKAVGEPTAYLLWNEYQGEVPTSFYETKIEKNFTENYNIPKPGVAELFESNPELVSIGTPEQYSQYLDTIFPDSKVKDIVYHGTKGYDKHTGRELPKFEKFDKTFIGKGQGLRSDDMAKGFYFGSYKIADRVGTRVMPVILNIEEENPTTVRRNTEDFDTKGDVFVVFEPEQIHILGSKEDIEGFKKFVKQSLDSNIKQSLAAQLAIEDSQAVAYYDNNGKIILKPGYVPTEELLIHEFSHPFVDRIAEDNPNVFNKLLKDINSTEEGKEIFNYVQENYSEKDSITKRKEVLVRAIAMVGKGYINKKTGNPIIQAVKKFLKFVTSMINRRLNEKMKTKDVIYATDLDLQTTVEEIAQLITMYEGKISTSKTDRLDNPEFNKLPKDIQDKLLPRIMEGRLVKVVENGLNSYYSLLGKTFQRQSDYNKNIKEFNPDNPSFKDSVTNLNNATVVGNYIDILSREFFKNPNITFKQAVEFFKDPQFKGILNEMSFNSTITQLKRVKSELQKIHGENAAFITEEFFLFKEGEVEGFDGVAGKTDIIVVDDKGKFHVYDVKNKFVKQSAEEAKNKINKRFREGEPSDIEKWSKQQETYSEMFKSITKEPFVTKNVIVFPVTYEREVFTGETINDVQEFKPVPTINEGRFIKDNAFIMSTIKADVKLPEPKVIPKAPIVAPNTIKKEATKVDEELQIPDEVLMGGLPQGYWDSVLGKNSSAPTTNTNLNTMPSPASKTAMPSKLEIAQKMQEARNRRKNEIPNLSPENKRIFESEEFKEWARKNAANDYTSSLKELIENYNKCHP